MSTCTAFDARTGRECIYEAVLTVTAGCQHEHVGPRDLCDTHLGDLEEGYMVCGGCMEAKPPAEDEIPFSLAGSHMCPLRVLVLT